jgi:hypothetical protein
MTLPGKGKKVKYVVEERNAEGRRAQAEERKNGDELRMCLIQKCLKW